jgi:hypothetical protein
LNFKNFYDILVNCNRKWDTVNGGLTNVSCIVTATLIWNNALTRDICVTYSIQVTVWGNWSIWWWPVAAETCCKKRKFQGINLLHYWRNCSINILCEWYKSITLLKMFSHYVEIFNWNWICAFEITNNEILELISYTTNNSVYRDGMLCILIEIYRCFEGLYYLHFQFRRYYYMFGVCGYRRVEDCTINSLTPSELQVTTALTIIFTFYKSPQHPLSLFQPAVS